MNRAGDPGPGFTRYEPASARPAGYPADLPFIAGAVATVGDMPTTPPMTGIRSIDATRHG